MIFKWALKTLKSQFRFSLFFVLNLSLGLAGFLTLQTFRVSLQQVMQSNSKTFLAADLSLSARRRLNETEIEEARKILGPEREESRLYEFFSMGSTKANSRLVQVKAIEGNYPFYGSMTLASGRKITGPSEKEIIQEDKVWVYPEVLIQLGVQVGDKIRLGEADYVIADSIVDDSTQTFRLSTIAPKIFVGMGPIEKSKLVQKGTTFTEALLFRVNDDSGMDTKAKEIFKKIPDPAVQVMAAKEAGEESAKPLAYLADYLGLVSLVALFLAVVGSAFLYRSFFSRQIRSLAIYNVLGLQFGQISQVLLVQILVLGVSSALLSLLGVLVLFPALSLVLSSISPLEVPLYLNLDIIGIAFLLSTLGSVAIGGFFVLSLRELNPAQLFQEQYQAEFRVSRASLIFLLVPTLLFGALSVWQAHSWKIGGLFFVLFFASLGVVLVLNLALLKYLGEGLTGFSWVFKHVGLQLSRKLRQNLSTAVALSLGSLLMTLLPQLRGSLQNEVQTPRGSALPALFLFDIQDEQLKGIKEILTPYHFSELPFSPLVRARILKVNDKSFEKITESSRVQTREEETENRFRNRGFNLSYRSKLYDSEAIVDGKFWQSSFEPASGKLPEVSIEAHFAERLKFRLGDVLTFDVQGVEIQGQITSFRSVRWNTFQPNFFVQFQPGVLDQAPKTWVVSVPTLAREKSSQLQNDIAKVFPNISAVDVSRTVEKALGMADKMSWSLQFMAALCFATGFFVLYSVVSQQVQESRWDLNLQKMMGASFLQSGQQVWLQYSILGLISSTVGGLLSLAVSAILSVQIFEMAVSFDAGSILGTVLGATGISFLLSLVASWRVIRAKPLLVLQG